MSGFLRQVSAIVGKELRIELRTREVLYTMVFFGLVIVVVFGFGLFERSSATRAAPGVLWTALLLAGTTSINRTFDREREGNCIMALSLVPGIAWSLFLGKMVANFLYLVITLSVVAPLVLLVFQFDRVPNAGGVVAALGLGALGYSILGTLVGGMLGQVRMRAIMLPLVLFPMVIPVFGIGVTATGALLSEGDTNSIAVEVPEDPQGGIALSVEGLKITVDTTGASRDEVATVLHEELEAALETGKLASLRVTRSADDPTVVLVGEPGRTISVRSEGLDLEESELQSSGWGFLPILGALDLVLLLVSMWLFGRVMDPD